MDMKHIERTVHIRRGYTRVGNQSHKNWKKENNSHDHTRRKAAQYIQLRQHSEHSLHKTDCARKYNFLHRHNQALNIQRHRNNVPNPTCTSKKSTKITMPIISIDRRCEDTDLFRSFRFFGMTGFYDLWNWRYNVMHRCNPKHYRLPQYTEI